MDKFIAEVKLQQVSTLDELNKLWELFLENYYHKKPHDGIKEYYESFGKTIEANESTPLVEFQRDTRELCYLDKEMVHEAFLHHEKRLVDKGACISFKGKKYETKAELIGYNVEISYDPAHPEEITVSYPGIEPFHASPLKIDEYCSHEPYVPVSVKQMNPNTKPVPSRMLKAVEKADEKQKKQLDEILSFANFRKGVK